MYEGIFKRSGVPGLIAGSTSTRSGCMEQVIFRPVKSIVVNWPTTRPNACGSPAA